MKTTTTKKKKKDLIFTKSGPIFRDIIVNLVISFKFILCPKLHRFFLVQTKDQTIAKGNHGNRVS